MNHEAEAVGTENERATLNLWPETGRILGLGRGAIYEAARRGEIPVIRIGRRILVPRRALEKMLDAGATEPKPAESQGV